MNRLNLLKGMHFFSWEKSPLEITCVEKEYWNNSNLLMEL